MLIFNITKNIFVSDDTELEKKHNILFELFSKNSENKTIYLLK